MSYPNHQTVVACAIDALDDLKAKEITTLDVKALTDVAETLIIANATSKRHVNALANQVAMRTKQIGASARVEGEGDSDWVLVDLGALIVHIMTPDARAFYDLEGLWSSPDALKALAVRTKE